MRLTIKTAIALLTVLAGLCATAVVVNARPNAKKRAGGAVAVKTVAVAKNKLRVGETLKAPKLGRHVDHYQWLRCNRKGNDCRAIRGATHRQYTIQKTDIGHELRVREALQGNAAAESSPTGAVGRPLPVNTAVPTITDGGQGGGTLSGPVIGDVLTGSLGTWTNAVSYTFQWEDCTSAMSCTAISGATSQTYTLQSSDVGDTIEFVVTAYNYTAPGSTP